MGSSLASLELGVMVNSLTLSFTALRQLFTGSMYSPSPWWATSDCSPNEQKYTECQFRLQVPQPEVEEDRCFKDETTNGCSRSGGRNAWFTNFTRVPEVTLDEEFLGGKVKGDDVIGYNPWTSPGAAPVYGNGCGLNGGNPDGCDGEGEE